MHGICVGFGPNLNEPSFVVEVDTCGWFGHSQMPEILDRIQKQCSLNLRTGPQPIKTSLAANKPRRFDSLTDVVL